VKSGRRGGGLRRGIGIAAVIVAVVGMGLAAFVVVRSAGRIQPPRPPVNLAPVPADQELALFKRNLKRRVTNLSRRFDEFRLNSEQMTPEQESLALTCESSFARIRREIGVMDTIMSARLAQKSRREIVEQYRVLKESVSFFARTFMQKSLPDLESLDRELEQLLNE